MASAANVPGPSNLDLWNMLMDKEAQLKEKDARLTELLNEKDAQLKDKDAQLTEMLKDKDAQLKDKDVQLKDLNSMLNTKNERLTDVLYRTQQVENQLSWTTDALLKIKGKRNLRGALEFAAKGISGDDVGVSTCLKRMVRDRAFGKMLTFQCCRFHVDYNEAEKCLGTIYGVLSQDMHGTTDDTVRLRYADITPPVQRAVLHAVFDFKCIHYETRDEEDNVVEKVRYG
jgi:hypothetical protein